MSGIGNAKEAAVDNNNRISAKSITEATADRACDTGNRYNINSGTVNLTNSAESAILFFHNHEDSDYVINEFVFNIGDSSGGGPEVIMRVYFGATGGTLVTDETPADIVVNQNLGSNNTLDADIFKGAQGKTQTGGTLALANFSGEERTVITNIGKVIVPKGKSVAITIEPPTGNSSLNVQAIISGYLATAEVTGE